ncbi:retention module-containing protein [Pseudomonas putida]|uniref:retention module-containing protein n=1 Tax=Pseudomonas putida TaxID=303 RepID=UPI0018E686A2|nr:retention module-containing protein [Pseudomonas putida]MBI6941959.1 retention module-containing protein [Pseudomonas putida]MBI6958182.1 retention module-containing protein [Pseudomonas putida]
MAKLVGVVSKVVGEVFALGSDGSRRPLIEGDRLFAGEQLETGAAGAVAVRLQSGGELTLGRDSIRQMTADLLTHHAHPVHSQDASPSAAQLTDVERIQQAIAAGADPSETSEAPAAGPDGAAAPGALGGGHSVVMLTEVAARVDPVVGFPTAGFNGTPELANRYVGDLGNGRALRAGDSGGGGTDGGLPPGQPNPPGEPNPPLTPTDENHPVQLRGLELNPGDPGLDEANLPLGSASNPAALTQHGSFTVVAPDGVFNLTLGGISVVTAGVVTGVGQSITTALGNILTITGYDPATGVVSYSYTLTGAEQHAEGAGTNSLSEHFPVFVSDTDGDTAQGTLQISIRDDVPTAVDDSHPFSATELRTELTGNVLSNDVQGADRVPGGPVIAGTFVGTYGTLILAADGSYTYTLNTGGLGFKNLGGGGHGVESFTYTIKDADGDTSSATLTLNISNLDDPVTLDGLDAQGGELTLHEKHLHDGSAPDASALTQQGTFKVTAPDGLQSLTVGGISVISAGVAAGFAQSIVTAQGNTLTITGYDPATGVVSYSYTLVGNESHPSGQGSNSISEHFQVIAKDVDGSTATGSLDVNIVDDVPTANSDYVSVAKGDVVRGNVMLNDVVGADTRSDGQYVVGVRAGSDTSTSAIGQLNTQVHGQYGYLTIDAYGNAEYHSDPTIASPRDALETFVYTIRDADGDESTTTITINVHNGLIACADHDVTVYEKALDLIKDGNDLAAGTVTGSDPGSTLETASGTLVGSASGGVGALTFSLVGSAVGQYGQIQLNADGSYTYTLTSPANSPTHANDGANTVTETFTYQVRDSLGNSTTSTIVISIVDDVPTANSDYVSVGKGDVVRGNVMLNDVIGADTRGDGQYVVGVRAGSDTSTSAIGQLNTQVHGQYGYLTIDAYGNAEYHSDPTIASPRDALETFVYTIRDADGDESTTTITINVHNGLIACADHDVTVYEKALDLIKDGNDLAAGTVTGSDPGSTLETASGTLVGSTSGGVGALTYTLVGNAVGQYGQIQLNADGSYTYTLTSPANSPTHANDGANTVTETFTYQVRDSLGNSTTSTIVISIVDDVPTANSDYVSVGKGDVVRGNVMLNDVIGADTRSDGQYVVGVRAGSDTSTSAIGQLNTQVHGQYGYLTIDAYGNAEYHSNPDAVAPRDALETFVYTIRDADGDESTTTLTINVHTHSLDPCGDGGVKVYESALDLIKDGNDLAAGTVTGSDPTSPRETAIGSLVGQVAGGVGALTYTLVGNAVGQYGQIHLNADGSYTYTLTSPANSPTHANDGANTVTESFTYRVEDTVGNWTTSTVTITIVDDVPQAHCDYVSVGKGDVVRGNVLLNDVIGADVPSDCGYVVGVRAGHDTSTSAIGQLGSKVFGQYGYLTLDAQGNAVYHSDPDVVAPRDAVDRFVYTIRDGDGDESTTTITVNVHDNSISECGDGYGRGLEQRFVDRGAFTLDASSMTAALVVLGYLGASGAANAQGNADEVINISLRTGETLQLNQAHHDASLALAWKEAGGTYQAIAAGDSFTASHDGVYSIQVSDPVAASKGGESYQLSMVLDYARAPDAGVHAGAGVDPAAISPVGAMGVTSLVGHAAAGVEASATANYALAKEGVTIDLSHDGAQDTGSAGLESFNGIHNLVGSDYGDILIGNNGDNVLIGGGGNDVLKGGDGNDTLIGGVGDDSLTGGNGNDIFIWQKGDSGHDTVTDFTPGSDKLDLSQLLQGEHATASSLDDYLHFKVNGTGANVVSTIEVSSVAGAAPTQTIDLAGVDLAQHYGVTAGAGGVVSAGHDTATIINGMLDDHSLKVDTV